MPEYAKDVCIALIGADIALAGLLLVVSGFALAQANSFPSSTDDAILGKYEKAAKLGLIPFFLALFDAGLCLAWLLHSSGGMYIASVSIFFLLLVLTGLYGAILLLRYL